MKAVFSGFISVDKNAVFSVPVINKAGKHYATSHHEVKDGVNVDGYFVGMEYDLCESLLKKSA
jgi:hypothetical protein